MPKLFVSADTNKHLTAWLYCDFYVKRVEYYEGEVIVPAHVFVCLEASFDIHQAPQVPLKTLEQGWRDAKTYLSSACEILQRESPRRSLTKDERKRVLTTLGEPPSPAWPLYFFSVGEFPEEKIVYIGKTNSRTHRFSTGHSAITALHRPEYREMRKRLYLATVTIYSDEQNYIPLEWLHPKTLRDSIWSDVEAQLIFHFQPQLNSSLKNADRSKRPLFIAFHNYSGTKSFDGEGILPHRDVSEDEWLYS